MGKFEGLEFEALPVRTLADERVRVTAMSRSRFRLTFNAQAYERLGKPDALRVDYAERDGARFVRIAPAKLGGGWPVLERQFADRTPSGMCTIIAPFPIGVVHRAEDAEVDWAGDTAIVALPDWESMLANVEAAAE